MRALPFNQIVTAINFDRRESLDCVASLEGDLLRSVRFLSTLHSYGLQTNCLFRHQHYQNHFECLSAPPELLNLMV